MKVLFFAPHSAIWVHAFPEALVAEALHKAGHEVVYVTCGEVLANQCVAMNASGVGYSHPPAERKRICKQCNSNKALLRKRIGLQCQDMAGLLRPEDYRQVEELLSGLGKDNFLALEVSGVSVGRYALYELLLNRKKNDLRMNDDEWHEYLAVARGALLALLAVRRLLVTLRPDRVITYNSLYAVNRVVSKLAEAQGAMPYFLHAGGNLSKRLQTLMIGRDYTFRFIKSLVSEWPRYRDRPCPVNLIEQATDHMLVLFRGVSAFGYSAPAGVQRPDVRERFGIRGNQKILLATMSSSDERLAAEVVGALPKLEDLVFPTQVEWIRSLLRFVAERPDLFLLIRVHPREFPNKREHVKSRNADLLAEAFSALPPNAAVNWPTDNLALYDLANYADVILNAWSSAGKEMSLLGLPVVLYSRELPLYPADLNYVGESERDYYRMLEQALHEGWSLERSRAAYRWLALEYGYSLIDISESYLRREHVPRTLAGRIAHRIRYMFDRDYVQKSDCDNRARALKNGELIAKTLRTGALTPIDPRVERMVAPGDRATEDRALRAALARMGAVLFGGDPRGSRGPLAQHLAQVSS